MQKTERTHLKEPLVVVDEVENRGDLLVRGPVAPT